METALACYSSAFKVGCTAYTVVPWLLQSIDKCDGCLAISRCLLISVCTLKGNSNVETYSVPPLPPHLEQNSHSASHPGVLRNFVDTQGLRGVVRDTCYHLLKLYSKRDHRLERTLSPATYGPLPLDYFLRLVATTCI